MAMTCAVGLDSLTFGAPVYQFNKMRLKKHTDITSNYPHNDFLAPSRHEDYSFGNSRSLPIYPNHPKRHQRADYFQKVSLPSRPSTTTSTATPDPLRPKHTGPEVTHNSPPLSKVETKHPIAAQSTPSKTSSAFFTCTLIFIQTVVCQK